MFLRKDLAFHHLPAETLVCAVGLKHKRSNPYRKGVQQPDLCLEKLSLHLSHTARRSLKLLVGKGEVSKPGAAVEGVGVLQIHHFFFHNFVLRLHIPLLYCKCADKAVIKENKGLGSNTPFCK